MGLQCLRKIQNDKLIQIQRKCVHKILNKIVMCNFIM